MPTGFPKGRVHVVFKKLLKSFKTHADENYKGHKFEEQRVWEIPEDLMASNLFDIASLHKPSFDRDEINTNFKECMADPKNPGTVGDIISLTTQCDYVAAAERAFRSRMASPVRCFAHSAARQRGRAIGPGITRIEEDAANAIMAGAG